VDTALGVPVNEPTLGLQTRHPRNSTPWSVEPLTFSVLGGIEQHLDQQEFAPLARYLLDHPPGHARWLALSSRIADTFDRYINYRPAMLARWSQGELVGPAGRPLADSQNWQPRLWEYLSSRIGHPHPGQRLARALETLDTGAVPTPFPEALFFFGLSGLPPTYLDLLAALSRSIDLHLFLPSPTEAYWADLPTRREALARFRRTRHEEPDAPESTHHEPHNPLLASLGRVARDAQALFVDREIFDRVTTDQARFPDPTDGDGPPTLLRVLQSDILHLRHRGHPLLDPGESTPAPLTLRDDSVQLHACHGPMRQVQIVRDVLLGLLQDHPSLQPRDILVVSPDIATYAPLVTAVFGAGRPVATGSGPGRWDPCGPRLPVRVVDRSLRTTNPVADALARVLTLVDSRVTASQVLDLLILEPVRLRFGLRAEDMPLIQGWLDRSGIRWGLDAAHRRHHEQPTELQNTWRFGLDRLLLGVAMADDGARTPGGLVPFDEMEGGSTELLGRFVQACEVLFEELDHLRAPRAVADWAHAALRVVHRTTRTPEGGSWLTDQVRQILEEIPGTAEHFDGQLELGAFRRLVEGRFEVGRSTIGSHAGAITFCALEPMRSVPHRVVVLLGMDDGLFPRRPGSTGFDLLGTHRIAGDPDPREQDRALLLEAILAARSHLLITWTGRDIHTNAQKPPAVPIAELLDVIDASFRAPTDADAASNVSSPATMRELLTRVHTLHPFGIDNFGPGEFQSFDQRMIPSTTNTSEEGFLDGLPTAAVPETLEIDALCRFLRNPTRFLLEKRLSLYLDENSEEVHDREPIALDGRQTWALGDRLLAHASDSVSSERSDAYLRGGGQLPLGTAGDCLAQDLRLQARDVHDRASPYDTESLDRNSVHLSIGPTHLSGTVDQVGPSGRVLRQFGSIRPRHLLDLWVRHLALVASAPEPPAWSLIVGKARPNSRKHTDFPTGAAHIRTPTGSPDESRAWALGHLSRLVELWRRGHDEALALFENASFQFAWFTSREQAPRSSPFAKASSTWRTGGFRGGAAGDGEDASVLKVFGDVPFEQIFEDPDLGFQDLALQLWNPILESLTEGTP
jgi:exodeoxyribonuclease V gamma subunit